MAKIGNTLKMIDVYIVYIYENEVSGFKTYKESLYQCINQSGFRCHDIVLNSPCCDFVIKKKSDIKLYEIPKCQNSDAVGTLLSLYITDKKTNVFCLQFSKSYPVMSMLKKYFPQSKYIFVIHDFIWASKLNGDIEKFKSIVTGRNEHDDYNEIIDIYEDGVKTIDIIDQVVCLSPDTKSILQEVYKVDPSKISLIQNGLKDEFNLHKKNFALRAKYGLSKGDKIFLFVGRLTQQKGCYTLLEAISKVVHYHTDVKFVLAGKYHESLLRQIPDIIRKYVLLLGCISSRELYEWYQEADFGIISTYYEQCSYVGIEMKMFGLPVIASNGFGVNCMFNNDNGLIFELWNKNSKPSNSLANVLLKALSLDLNEIEKLKNNSREDYLHTYSIENMMHSYELLIHSLVEQKN